MANFSALKTAIQNAIKQNGNEEITGNVLQQILLSIVSTMGDGAINTIEQNLSDETLTRQNADNTLQQNIDSEVGARKSADNTLQSHIDEEALTRENADTQLQNVINAIKSDIDNGYVYAGIATPSSTPVSGKVFYIATAAGTYTNFGGQVLTQGVNILRYNGSAWSSQQLIGIDNEPKVGSNNLVKSGGVQNELALGAVYDVSAKNPTGGPNNDGKWESISALLSDANINTLIPTAYRKGGMSIKFIHNSDNKYVQYMLKTQAWSTTVSDWEKLDIENEVNKCKDNIELINYNHLVETSTYQGTSNPSFTIPFTQNERTRIQLILSSVFAIKGYLQMYNATDGWVTISTLEPGKLEYNITFTPQANYIQFRCAIDASDRDGNRLLTAKKYLSTINYINSINASEQKESLKIQEDIWSLYKNQVFDYNITDWKNGYLLQDDGVTEKYLGETGTGYTIGFYPVNPGQVIKFNNTTVGNYKSILFYDKNLNFVESFASSLANNAERIIPANCYFARFQARRMTSLDIVAVTNVPKGNQLTTELTNDINKVITSPTVVSFNGWSDSTINVIPESASVVITYPTMNLGGDSVVVAKMQFSGDTRGFINHFTLLSNALLNVPCHIRIGIISNVVKNQRIRLRQSGTDIFDTSKSIIVGYNEIQGDFTLTTESQRTTSASLYISGDDGEELIITSITLYNGYLNNPKTIKIGTSESASLSWLKDKECYCIGDSLTASPDGVSSTGRKWMARFNQISGSITDLVWQYNQKIAWGGTRTLQNDSFSGQMRTRKLLSLKTPDIIFLQNVNDNSYPTIGNLDDEPFMTSEIYNLAITPLASEALAKTYFQDNLLSCLDGLTPQHGVIVNVPFDANGLILTVSGTATGNGTITLQFGVNVYGIEVSVGDSVSDVIDKIIEWDYTGMHDTKVGNNQVVFSNASSCTITNGSGKLGITITQAQGTAINYTGFGFASHDTANWETLSYWKEIGNIGLCAAYKGLIEYINTISPTTQVYMLVFPHWLLDYTANTYKRADGTYDWDAFRAAFTGMYSDTGYQAYQKKCAEYMNTPVVDVVKNMSMNIYNLKTYWLGSDNVHLNANGYDRLADIIYMLIG